MAQLNHMTLFSSVATILLSATFIISAEGEAQIISHKPQDGDRLHPNVAFSRNAISRVDTSKRTVKFSSSDFFELDDCDAFVYVDTDTVSFIQFSTKHTFTYSDGLLRYEGYENRASDFRPTTPIPITSTNRLTDTFEMQMGWDARMSLYGMELLKKAKGISRSNVQKGWTLVTEADSIKDATYMAWDMEMSYFDTGSIDLEFPDSINTEAVSDMQLNIRELSKERMLTRREIWFAEDARYPVLIRSRTLRLTEDGNGITDTIPISYFTSHYPMRLQYEDFGEDGAFQTSPKHVPGNTPGGLRERSNTQDIAEITDPVRKGERLNMTLTSRIGADKLSLTLYSVSGIRLTETTEVTVGAIPQQVEIPIPVDSNDIVIILIESDYGSTFRKIIL